MIEKNTDINKNRPYTFLQYNPDIKQINFLENRVYKIDEDTYYPSVTTILQYLPKDRFFETWLKDTGHNSDIIKNKAAKEGTEVHNAIESLLNGDKVEWINSNGRANFSEKVWQMILKFVEFYTTYKPKILLVEKLAFSDEMEYAGTVDLIFELDGYIWLVDIKTSNQLHRVYNLQLAAYKNAIQEKTGVEIDKTAILWLKAKTRKQSNKKGVYQGKGWQLKNIDNYRDNLKLFKHVYEIYKADNPKVEPIYKQYPTELKLELNEQ